MSTLRLPHFEQTSRSRQSGTAVSAPPVSLVQNNMSISLAEHPEYVRSITALVEALRPYPEARRAAAATLRGLDDPKVIEAAD